MTETKVILTIGSWDSRCGACGLTCDPTEYAHVRKCGYDQHEGCGAVYTHVTAGRSDLEARVREMRPDLIPVDAFGEPLPAPDIEEFEFTLTLKALRQLKDEARAEVQAERDVLRDELARVVDAALTLADTEKVDHSEHESELCSGALSFNKKWARDLSDIVRPAAKMLSWE